MEDSEFSIPCDMVVPAIGQGPDQDFGGAGMETSKWGTIVADDETCATGIPGVFAGGDAVSGPATAIEAVAAGNRAARAIHDYLESKEHPVATANDAQRFEQRVSIPPPERIAEAEPGPRLSLL